MNTDSTEPALTRTLARPFIALDLDGEGSHPAAASWTGVSPQEAYSGTRLVRRALAGETAGVNALVFADRAKDARAEDHPVNLAATHAAAFTAPLTSRVALIAEADTVLSEPFHLAMQLMTLDQNSLGRAGWLVHGTASAVEAAAVGRQTPDGVRVRREVADSIEVNRRLWDSWEDGAEIRDVATGRFIDAGKIHHIDFEGEYYSVKSSAIAPRTPQGQIPVLAPRELVETGADVDAVQVHAQTVDGLIDAVGRARAEGFRIVVAELPVAVDALGVPAAGRLARLDAERPWTPGALASGTAVEVTDVIARVLEVADGVRLRPAVYDVDLPELAEDVLPELRRRLPLADNAPDGTFRSLLGLGRPASRYAATQKENR